MAEQIIHKLIDDIDGSDADQMVTFGIDGVHYRIDLCDANAELLREYLAPYIEAGRPVKPQRSRRKSPRSTEPGAVRTWAEANGYTVSPQGRIPTEVLDAYTRSMN